MTYYFSCKICLVNKIKRKISVFVIKISLTEKFLFIKTSLTAGSSVLLTAMNNVQFMSSQVNQTKYQNYQNEWAMGGQDGFLAYISVI